MAGRDRERKLMSSGFTFWFLKKCSKTDYSDIYTILNIVKTFDFYTLNE